MTSNQITKGLACVDAGTLFDRVIKCVSGLPTAESKEFVLVDKKLAICDDELAQRNTRQKPAPTACKCFVSVQ